MSRHIFLRLFNNVLQGLSFYLFYVTTILYVVTGIVMLRHRQLCRDSAYVHLLQIGVATEFLCCNSMSVWFLLQQCFDLVT